MEYLKLYSKETVAALIQKRDGEKKYGEAIITISNVEEIENTHAKYVLVGIPEDIGVRANRGNVGAANTWNVILKTLLNIQANAFTNPENVLLLGEIDVAPEMEEASKIAITNPKYHQEFGKLVSAIDVKVANVVETIVKAGKIPILIGGGHNNAYGAIKGTSLALKKPVNAINFDVHSDFRILEERHSGNGFSYAFSEGYLQKYFIFGLQKNYTSEGIFKTLNQIKNKVTYILFEDIIQKEKSFRKYLKSASKFITTQSFGLEIDVDAIENISSSARTPSGFSVKKARRFVSYFGSKKNCAYIHICEGIPENTKENQIGKLITFLITDFTGNNKLNFKI